MKRILLLTVLIPFALNAMENNKTCSVLSPVRVSVIDAVPITKGKEAVAQDTAVLTHDQMYIKHCNEQTTLKILIMDKKTCFAPDHFDDK